MDRSRDGRGSSARGSSRKRHCRPGLSQPKHHQKRRRGGSEKAETNIVACPMPAFVEPDLACTEGAQIVVSLLRTLHGSVLQPVWSFKGAGVTSAWFRQPVESIMETVHPVTLLRYKDVVADAMDMATAWNRCNASASLGAVRDAHSRQMPSQPSGVQHRLRSRCFPPHNRPQVLQFRADMLLVFENARKFNFSPEVVASADACEACFEACWRDAGIDTRLEEQKAAQGDAHAACGDSDDDALTTTTDPRGRAGSPAIFWTGGEVVKADMSFRELPALDTDCWSAFAALGERDDGGGERPEQSVATPPPAEAAPSAAAAPAPPAADDAAASEIPDKFWADFLRQVRLSRARAGLSQLDGPAISSSAFAPVHSAAAALSAC